MEDFYVDGSGIDVSPAISTCIFATWLCLFLAFWQYTFGITDTAFEHLLKFLKAFLTVLGKRSVEISQLATFMPPSLYMLWKRINPDTSPIKKYVVCTKCYKLYTLNECITKIQGVSFSKGCNNIQFPNHPQKRYQKPCEQLLLLTFVSLSGKKLLYPVKTYYCYLPLQHSIQKLLSQTGFAEQCEEW